jgi:hypothetical protein
VAERGSGEQAKKRSKPRKQANGRTVMRTASGNSETIFEPGGVDTLPTAYVNALNRLLVKREKHVPEALAVAR